MTPQAIIRDELIRLEQQLVDMERQLKNINEDRFKIEVMILITRSEIILLKEILFKIEAQ